MFPAPNHNTPASDEQDSTEQIEPVALKGWRWVLSWIVGNALASSPSLPLFLMVMVGDFLATMSLCIPYTFLPAVAVGKGIGAQDAAFLISAAGISSTVGLIICYSVTHRRPLRTCRWVGWWQVSSVTSNVSIR